ncbi:hypothetical protein LF296_12765 [Acinetobacter vivianii]|uniref:Uncharacterized protein n=1 Tax=Acinetobacter vivianii TaxID=1776742 RepID=A0AAJ6NGZ4_9GAMM|nr:hypothetical protein [Acinetobacter vivianii]WDZ50192.1 hypothetical protein LF296_12765 [Acinetobacter vivianii]
MKPRIYKKLCRKAFVILVYGFNFSVEDFISDNSGIPFVCIKDCYEPFECSALDMLLEMMRVQDLDCDVHSLKANAKLIKEAIRFTSSIYLSACEGAL